MASTANYQVAPKMTRAFTVSRYSSSQSETERRRLFKMSPSKRKATIRKTQEVEMLEPGLLTPKYTCLIIFTLPSHSRICPRSVLQAITIECSELFYFVCTSFTHRQILPLPTLTSDLNNLGRNFGCPTRFKRIKKATTWRVPSRNTKLLEMSLYLNDLRHISYGCKCFLY